MTKYKTEVFRYSTFKAIAKFAIKYVSDDRKIYRC